MNTNKDILKSPINEEDSFELFLKCKDYTVSKKTFSLYKDENSELLITHPQPKKEELGSYYESEEYISHTDSNKSLFDKIYQIAKKRAIKNKIKIVEKVKSQNSKFKILDIGCGTGDFLKACQIQNWKIVGVEPNKKARVLAKSKLGFLTSKTTNFEFNNSNVYKNMNEIENTFDVITLWHVLEHIPNLEEYIVQLKNKLNKNGILIIAVPNYKSYDAKHYKEFWAAFDVPRHLWHFSQKSIKLLFNKIDMKVAKTIPMKMDSYYVSLLSEKYKTGKSNPIKAFIIGFWSNFKAWRTKEYSSLIYILKNK